MTREFIYTQSFRKSWEIMGLNDDEDKKLNDKSSPSFGQRGATLINESGLCGARKMRIQLYGQGKRGGARVIYIDVYEKEKLYLLFAYPKNVQENLTSEQKKAIKTMIETIKKG